jgi:multiple sugar transport system permease protein
MASPPSSQAAPMPAEGGRGSWRRRTTKTSGSDGWRAGLDRQRVRTGILLTGPALLALGLTTLYPIFWTVALSFQSFGAIGAGENSFVGWENYARIFGSPEFCSAMVHTIEFVFVTLVIEALISMPLALSLHRPLPGSKFFRAIVALPLMVAPVVAALAWRFLFADGYGLIDSILHVLGVTGPSWFANVWLAGAAIVIANLWLAVPFATLMLLAGLANIPRELTEAAKIDGASGWQIFCQIIFPLLRPVIAVILVVRLADSFRVFDVVYVLTGGGPANGTDVMSTYIYKLMFTNVDFSGGSAASTVLVLLTGAISAGSVLLLRRR